MIFLYMLIKNIAVIVCMTFLAVHFDKWWIVLFALLFFTFYTSQPEKKDEPPKEG